MLKGNKPDFHNAMNSETSQPMYDDFLIHLGSLYNCAAVKGTKRDSGTSWGTLEPRIFNAINTCHYWYYEKTGQNLWFCVHRTSRGIEAFPIVSTSKEFHCIVIKCDSLYTNNTGGQFGAYMKVQIENDGPVTLDIESPQLPPPKEVSILF